MRHVSVRSVSIRKVVPDPVVGELFAGGRGNEEASHPLLLGKLVSLVYSQLFRSNRNRVRLRVEAEPPSSPTRSVGFLAEQFRRSVGIAQPGVGRVIWEEVVGEV